MTQATRLVGLVEGRRLVGAGTLAGAERSDLIPEESGESVQSADGLNRT
ncbi:MAG: hypothetical protein ACT4QD_18390 [Acidobacteriota bacterium]